MMWLEALLITADICGMVIATMMLDWNHLRPIPAWRLYGGVFLFIFFLWLFIWQLLEVFT